MKMNAIYMKNLQKNIALFGVFYDEAVEPTKW